MPRDWDFMKVKISVYDLHCLPVVTTDGLFKALSLFSEKPLKIGSRSVIVKAKREGGLILGRVALDRNHSHYISLQKHTNRIGRGMLEQNENFAAFSFFIVTPRSPKAILTTYRESGGASLALDVLERAGYQTLEAVKKQALNTGSRETGEQKRIGDQFKGPSMNPAPYLGQEEFAAVLAKWKRIGEVELSYIGKATGIGYLPFNADEVNKTYVRISLKPDLNIKGVIKEVQTLRQHHLKQEDTTAEDVELRIRGTDDLGFDRSVLIEDQIPSLLGEFDHDKAIADPTTFADDLSESYVIKELKRIIANSPGIFSPR